MSMFCSGHELLTVRDAIRWIESQTTVKPSVETIHRWMRRGVRGRMLPSRQIGGVWYVSHDDLAAFIEAGDKRQTSGPVHDSSLALRAARRSSSVTPATPRSGIGVVELSVSRLGVSSADRSRHVVAIAGDLREVAR